MVTTSVYSLQQGILWKRLRANNGTPKSGSQQPTVRMLGELKKCTTKTKPGFFHINSIGTPFYTKNKRLMRKYINSATAPGNETVETTGYSNWFQDSFMKKLDVFHRFCRTYAIMATGLATLSVCFLPLQTMADLSPTFIIEVLKTMTCMALITLFTSGLNQVYDVEIDKVNKPFLPLASGEYSMKTGKIIVVMACSMSIGMGLMIRSPELLFVILSFFFITGIAYSVNLPFLRWKNNAFLAASSIMFTRGLCIPIGIFIHIQKYVLGRPIVITPSLISATIFMCIFSLAMAIYKVLTVMAYRILDRGYYDIPDLDGDKAFGSITFTVLLGKERVFWFCTYFMMSAYFIALLTAASSPLMSSKLIGIIGNSTLAFILWTRAQSVELLDFKSTYTFYLLICKLAYAEFLLMPFVR